MLEFVQILDSSEDQKAPRMHVVLRAASFLGQARFQLAKLCLRYRCPDATSRLQEISDLASIPGSYFACCLWST